MKIIQDKNILLGISGGIAAYKTPELVRRLKDHGANVRVVMTDGAKAFITPLTLQAVSGLAVSDSLLDSQAELAMGHIELAKWADVILIAPATADLLARLAVGMANDLLSTLCLASTAPIIVAPAMNQQMWHAQATQANINILNIRGVLIWGPGAGEQACGDVGLGRMLDVPDLVEYTLKYFSQSGNAGISTNAKMANPLKGQHWVITAGPTREAIDPVRYISNHSSGKMGYALAQEAQQLGAKVTIISGPVTLTPPKQCQVININSALEMYEQALKIASNADVFIACAAVADYRIDEVSDHKIKKSGDTIQLNLVKNPDIVASVAALNNKPFTVGFAAETQDLAKYAKGKLKSKNLDLIAANNVATSGQGFNSDNNALTVFSEDQSIDIPLSSKQVVAYHLVTIIKEKFSTK